MRSDARCWARPQHACSALPSWLSFSNRTMKSRLLRYSAIGAALLGVFAVAMMWRPPIAAEASPRVARDPDTMARGARVVAQGDCIVCHTAQGGSSYAGGLALKTPFGAIYSTNITPDPRTGIGQWTAAAFRRALRNGVSRDGHWLYPAFPYVHYTRMSDTDIADAYAYLMSRPAVYAPAKKNGLPLVFRFRPSLAFWDLLYLRSGANARDMDPVARGRYLAEGAGHCSSCHTPLDLIGGERRSHAYDGSVLDGWRAPALNTLLSASVPWTRSELIAYFSTGLGPHHGAAAGPMQPVVENMAKLPTVDLAAIADYLLSIQKQPVRSSQAASAPDQRRTTEGDARGERIFAGACGSCHESTAPMTNMSDRPSLGLSTAVNADDPRDTVQVILGGIPWPQEPSQALYMPPFEDVLSDPDIADLAQYLRTRFADKENWTDLANTIAAVHESRRAP
jgi:mono/diheme cytochrome c family protein